MLFDTGWDRHFGSPAYGTGAPYIAGAIAEKLVDAGAWLVGIDYVNLDGISADAGSARPANSALPAARVHVITHLTGLDAVPATGARFTAVPPKVDGFSTFPVRALASF